MKLINKRYEIIELIGEGEFGAIYKVKDIYSKNPEIKALKLYNFDKNRDIAIINFKFEFIFLKFFPLPFVPEVYDFNKVKNIDGNEISTNYYFYTMEYIKSLTFEDFVKKYNENTPQYKQIKLKIDSILQYLHKIGLYHGDFSFKNILIKIDNNSYLPFFIDLEEKSNILLDIERYKEYFKQDFNPPPTDYEILKHYKLEKFINLFFTHNVKSTIINLFEKIKSKNKIKIINFYKTNYECFDLIKGFIFSISQIYEFIFLEIDLNETYENNLIYLSTQLKKENYNSNIINKISEFLNNNIQKGFQNYYIFFTSILQEISFYNKTIIYLKNYDLIDLEKVQFVDKILNNIESNNLTILFNSYKFNENNYENILLFLPDKNINFDQIKKEILTKLNQIFLIENKLDISIDINKIIHFLKNFENYFETLKSSQKIDLFKDIKDLELEKFIKEKNFINFLILLFNLDSPFNYEDIINFCSTNLNIQKNISEAYLNLLLNKEFIYFLEYNKILINKNKIKIFIKDYIYKDKEFIFFLISKIIETYYNNLTELDISEYIYLSYLYLLIKDFKKSIQTLYEKVFLNIKFYQNRYNEKLSYFTEYFNINLNLIEKNYDNEINLFKSEEEKNLFIYIIILSIYTSTSLTFEEKERILIKIKSDNKIINFSKIFVLGKLYLINLNPEKLDNVFSQLEKIKEQLNQNEIIFYYTFINEYFYHKSDFSNLKKSINEVIEKFETENDYENENIPYLLCLSYINYGEYFFNNKDLEAYYFYNTKAKNLSEKYKFYDLLIVTYTNLGIYFYYQKNDPNKLKEFFNKAYILAEKFNIPNLIARTNNNIAAISDDIQEKKSHYLKALNYASYIEDRKIVLVLLYNLSKYLSPGKMEKLLKKFNKYIFTFKELDIVTNENFLLSTIASYYTLFRLGYENELKKYYDKLLELEEPFSKNEKNKNLFLIIKALYELKFLYKEEKTVKTKDFNSTINNKILLLKNCIQNTFSYNYQDIFYFVLTFLYNQNTKDNFSNYFNEILYGIKEFYKTKDKLKEDTLNIINNIFQNLNNIDYLKNFELTELNKITKLDIPILDYLALILKSIIYYLKNMDIYLRYLSSALFIYQKQKHYYKKEDIISKTSWGFFYQLLEKFFNVKIGKLKERKSFITNIDNINNNITKENIIIQKNFIKLNFNKLENEIINCISLELISGLKEFSKIIIEKFYFDRAIFYNFDIKDNIDQNKKLKKEFVLYFDENLYGSSEPTYISEDEILNINTIVLKKFNINEDEGINSTLIIPIFDPTKIKNIFITKNSRKNYSNYNLHYLYGYLYFDKKNNIKNKIDYNLLKNIQILLSLFYFQKIEEEKYLKDFLTKFYLRDIFYKKISNFLYDERNKNIPITFLYIDIDHFKKVNDTFGHQKGDEILTNVANIIRENVRRDDLTCRFGGEELIIALFNSKKDDGINIAEKIRMKVQDAKLLGDKMNLTISIGISNYPEDSRWIEELINIADKNLYKAKESGRNKVVYNI
ncbi:MAG: diguanylate cyclase [Spirochaetes bacterium]|nr:diguanylate cyclase [Spirochaetota bacterium]